MSSFLQDIRFGVRLLGRHASFTSVAVLVLALGIGANTAVFGVINAMLLKPRTGHPTGELVQVFSKDTTKPDVFRAFSYPNYADLRAHTEVFASLTAHNFAMAGLEDNGRTRRVFINIVTGNFFDTFGVQLPIGRTFSAEEERPNANIPVAVLSYAAWQRMGGGSDVLGKTVRLNARPFTVIGVAPQGFGGSMAMITPDMWVPTGVFDTMSNDFMREGTTGTLANRDHHVLVLIARLQPGASMSSVEAPLASAGAALVSAYPADNRDHALLMTPLSRMSVSTSPGHEGQLTALSVSLLLMSGLVLLIASFNLANMLLARGAARRREFAVRTAIGGSRWRLTRQLLVEGFVLALAGGVGGLLLSIWATRALVAAVSRFSPIAIAFDATPDARVLTAMIVCCGVATILFGLGPALGLARANALPALRDRASDLGSGRKRLRMQHVLVMGQLALSVVMLTVSGLFLRSAMQAAHVDPGFTFDRGVMIHADASLGGIDRSKINATYARVLDSLRARPDVAAASASSLIPFGEITETAGVQLIGTQKQKGDTGLVDSIHTAIAAGYFDTLGLKVIDGRDFTTNEERSDVGERLAIVDRPLAQRLFGNASPVGQLVQYTVHEGQPPVILRVVGEVPGTRHEIFDIDPVPHLYVPLGQGDRSDVYFHVRTSAPTADGEAALLPSLRRTVEAVDGNLPVLSTETRPSFRAHNLMFALLDLGAVIFMVFGGAALVLSMVGVYGVKAYVVSNRTREIGIRVALGATPRGVIWTVVREGFTLSMTGLAIGLVLAMIVSSAMSAMTLRGQGADLLTVGASMLILALAAVAASWLPARKAARADPISALRAD